MDLNSYQTKALRTAAHVRKNLLYGAVSLAGEAGELLDLVKKHVFHDRPLDKDKVALELGDALWSIAQAADALGYSLEDIAVLNVNKLEKRYPSGYSHEAAAARADVVRSDVIQGEPLLGPEDFTQEDPSFDLASKP